MKKTTLNISLPFYVWTGIMIILSSIPGDTLPEVVSFWQWDKLAHAFEYLVFTVLLFRFIRLRWGFDFGRCIKITAMIAIAFALFDEFHQVLIPGRQCAWQDFLADVIGIVLGFVIIHSLYSTRLMSASR